MKNPICKFVSKTKRSSISIFTLKGANKYECQSNPFTKKYARLVEGFANKVNISLDEALHFFYHSTVYSLMKDGVSDIHCMSDEYLIRDPEDEYLNLANEPV